MNSKEYLKNKHITLKNGYTTPDGKYAEHCGMIALEIAEILLHEGLYPETYIIRGNPTLIPVAYEHKVIWGAHQVCIANEMVYDPIIGNPVHISKYGMQVFNNNVTFELMFSTDKIIQILSRTGV